MQIEILNIWFGMPILVYEIKSKTWANANRQSVHFWAYSLQKKQLKI